MPFPLNPVHRTLTPTIVLALAIGGVLMSPNTQAQSAMTQIDLSGMKPGMAPDDFAFSRTGSGAVGEWRVMDDPTASNRRVIAQTSTDKTDYRFPLAIYSDFTGRDVSLSVQFKALSGKGDQGAGLVWRYRDQNNYYVTRCNALEDNCTIYHVVNGRRQAFQNKRTKVASNVWHILKMDATGDHFVVTYDGTPVLDAKDETFKDAGKVGLWTKADSVIAFDDFSIAAR